VRSIALVTVVVLVAAWVTLQLAPSAPSSPERRPEEPVGVQEVRSVSLVGHRVLQSQLRQVLETRPGEPLDSARFERDRAAMEHRLADLGYLAARVEPASVTIDAGAAYVIFEIDQGKLFHLRAIEVTGAGKDAAVVTLTSGDDARRDRIEHARAALAEALSRRGKPATVELSVRTDLAAAAVDVTFTTHLSPATGAVRPQPPAARASRSTAGAPR
jgi:outer membrane protein assembly factor BamA